MDGVPFDVFSNCKSTGWRSEKGTRDMTYSYHSTQSDADDDLKRQQATGRLGHVLRLRHNRFAVCTWGA